MAMGGIGEKVLLEVCGPLRGAFHGLVNPLDPVQILQELAPTAAKVLRPGPLHAGVFALPAAVKVAAGYFEGVLRIQYDEFLACHDLQPCQTADYGATCSIG